MNRDVVVAEKPLAACQLDTISSQTGFPLPKSYLQACIDLVRGDVAKAQAEFEAARPAQSKKQLPTVHRMAHGARNSDYSTRSSDERRTHSGKESARWSSSRSHTT